MNILVFSDDLFLISSLRGRLGREAVISIFSQSDSREVQLQDVILFDCMGSDFVGGTLAGTYLGGKLIVNIGPEPVENAINVQTPFRIDNVIERIANFLSQGRVNTVSYGFGTVNFSENILVADGGSRVVRFTEREMELIKTLGKGKIARKDLLEAVWGSKTQNDRVLETALHNIKRKLAEVSLESFIKLEDGHYQINDPTYGKRKEENERRLYN
ncbi:MAG: helix-turn-helix domain-containing protein [Rickettsiales bacterium]|jgi:hypothetical protein|nr:helix-turn-helix domain-containing protein [Rickettsiales bacterium]